MEAQQQRAAKLTILLGTNGTGKSTLLRNIITRSNQRTLIVTPDAAEWNDYPENPLERKSDYLFTGIQKHVYNPQTSLDAVSKFVKGTLVMDDFRAFGLSLVDERIHSLFIRRRQRELDIFFAAHGFREVPPVAFSFATDIFLFRTCDNIDVRRKDLNNFDEIKKLQAKVNAEAAKNPHYYQYYKWS